MVQIQARLLDYHWRRHSVRPHIIDIEHVYLWPHIRMPADLIPRLPHLRLYTQLSCTLMCLSESKWSRNHRQWLDGLFFFSVIHGKCSSGNGFYRRQQLFQMDEFKLSERHFISNLRLCQWCPDETPYSGWKSRLRLKEIDKTEKRGFQDCLDSLDISTECNVCHFLIIIGDVMMVGWIINKMYVMWIWI